MEATVLASAGGERVNVVFVCFSSPWGSRALLQIWPRTQTTSLPRRWSRPLWNVNAQQPSLTWRKTLVFLWGTAPPPPPPQQVNSSLFSDIKSVSWALLLSFWLFSYHVVHPNITWCIRMSRGASEYHVHPNITWCLRISRGASEYHVVHPNVTWCTRMSSGTY